MWALIGFAVGFSYGVKAGPEGIDRLKRAWENIRSSEEARDLVKGGIVALAGGVEEGKGLWALAKRSVASRLDEERERIVRIA